MSLRDTLVPTILYWETALAGAVPVKGTSKRLSPNNWPKVILRPGASTTDTIPFDTVSRSTGASNFFDAS